MSPIASDDEELGAIAERAIREAGLHPGFRATILQLVRRRDDEWRLCCGSGCEPCVDRLGEVVDAIRARWDRRDAS